MHRQAEEKMGLMALCYTSCSSAALGYLPYSSGCKAPCTKQVTTLCNRGSASFELMYIARCWQAYVHVKQSLGI